MRNKMSKLLSVLLTLVLLLSLAGPLAPSARAEGPYKVGLDDSFHGTVTADKATADEGETVRLTVTPSAGYIIESISVYAIDLHSAVPVTYSEGNYVFTMPASEVQASATFRPAAPTTTEIPSVGLALTLPAAGGSYGGSATASITSGTGFTLTGAKWFNGGTPETNPGCGLAPSSFEAGKPYFAEIYLTAEDGYGFTESTAVTLTGGATVKSTARDHGITTLTIVTNDYTIPAAAATTYTITVNGGKAYKAGGVEITSAAEGDSVYILFDDDAAPAGKYIEWGSAVTEPAVSISAGMISGTEYQAGFIMPAANITVSPDYLDQKSLTVDLTGGTSTDTSAASNAVWSLYRAEDLGLITADISDSHQEKFDLDKDGSWDVTYSTNDSKFSVQDSCSVTGDKTLTIPAAEYSPITFLFKAAAVPYTVDLSTGKMDLATGQEFADLFNSLGAWTHMSSTSGSSTYYYDLDKDGTEDISVTNSSSSRNVLLLTTSNITTDTYVISDSTGPYNPITFILKAPTVTTYPVTLIAYDKTNGTEQAGGEVAFSDSGKGTRISGDYEGNSSRTVGVYPASDYSFAGWAKGSPSGEIVSTSSPYTFTVTEDVTLYALFEKITTYPVWVGGVQVTSANKDDILGDGGKAKYDPDSKTLTLDNPSITTVHNGDAICTESGSLTIKGTATLSASVFSRADLTLIDANLTCTRISSYNTTRIESGTINVTSRGIACYSGHLEINGGELTVTSADGYGVNAPVRISGGTVDITGKTSGIYTSNISDNKAVEITGGTVTITGTGENGIYSPSGGVTISGGSVTATGGENGIRSEKDDGQILISGGTVKATGTSGDGISGICPIDITGGTVEATGGSAGIRTNRSITIGNSITKVTADGATNAIRGFDILLGDALIIQEPAGGTIGYMGGGNLVLDGENAATHAVIVPGTVVTTYPVWVGGEQVTSLNKDDILGDGGKAKFDPGTNTLTLDNPTISGEKSGAKIYIYDNDKTYTIDGTATIDGKISMGNGWNAALVIKGSITTTNSIHSPSGNITVDGNLTVSASSGYGINSGKNLTIQSGTVSITDNTSYGNAISAQTVTISGGTVTATGGDDGIHSYETVTISGGTVTATGGDDGIHSYGTVTISGGTVTATGTDIEGSGIIGDNVTISGGTVTAKGSSSGIDGGDAVKIENGITRVTADGDTEAINCYNGVITIGDTLIIQEPTGGKLSGDGKVIQNADDTVAKHAVIVPGEALPKVVGIKVNVTGTQENAGAYDVTTDTLETLFGSSTAPVTMSTSFLYTAQACQAEDKLTTAPVAGTPYYFVVSVDAYTDGETPTLEWADNDTIKSGSTMTADKGTVEIVEFFHSPAGGSLSVICKYTETVTPPTPGNWTVTFEANGGTPVPAAQTVADGGKATKPADPTKSGFVFDGWYADATFSVAFDFSAPITADVTVYAKWKEEAAPGEIVYTIVSGGNSTWTKGSSSGVTIVVKRDPNDEECFSHFASVQIGSTTLASGTDYTAVAGSTVITLNASALQKLTTGTKTVTINFDDGKATTNLTIKAGTSGPGTGTSPKTGDDSKPGLWLAVMMLSGLGIGGLVVNDKKRRYVSRH